MRIIKSTEAIPVEHPVFLIFGQPGIGKSSLGYSARDPLTLDFDHGAHRAANRRDTMVINSWEDIIEMMGSQDALTPYSTIVLDTVGRCLDSITADIAKHDPKKAPGGNLSQQGWGVLKNRFRNWTAALRNLGKDVLLIAHDKEDKDGESRIVRADIVGGSYNEVMKIADFVGYVYMSGKDRVLDFNPTDRWQAKNPGNWSPFKIPPIGKAQTFMAELMDKGRETLGKISEESAKVAQQVDLWRVTVDAMSTAADMNEVLPKVLKIGGIVGPQVKKMMWDRAKELKLAYDGERECFRVVEAVSA